LLELDPLALAVVLEPEIVQRYEMHYIEIELTGKLTRGQTVIDWENLTGLLHNVKVVMEIDRKRFWELMTASFE
jgi:purine nucleosidase